MNRVARIFIGFAGVVFLAAGSAHAAHLNIYNFSSETIKIVFFNDRAVASFGGASAGAGSSVVAPEAFKINTYVVPAGKHVFISKLILQNIRPQDIYILRTEHASACGEPLALESSLHCVLPDRPAGLEIKDDNVLEITIKRVFCWRKEPRNAVVLPGGTRLPPLTASAAYKFDDIFLFCAELQQPDSAEFFERARAVRVDCGCVRCDVLFCGCALCISKVQPKKGEPMPDDARYYNPDDFKDDVLTECFARSCLSYGDVVGDVKSGFLVSCSYCCSRKKADKRTGK